jgi:hypothetical protein
MSTGVQEGVFVKGIAEFLFEKKFGMRLWCDSSSARQLAKKKGPGKIRHLDLRTLFIQDYVESGQLVLKPISGEKNPSDILTKVLNYDKLSRHYEAIGIMKWPEKVSAVCVAAGGWCKDWVRLFLVACVPKHSRADDYYYEQSLKEVVEVKDYTMLGPIVFTIFGLVMPIVWWCWPNIRKSLGAVAQTEEAETVIEETASVASSSIEVIEMTSMSASGSVEQLRGRAGALDARHRLKDVDTVWMSRAGQVAHLFSDCYGLRGADRKGMVRVPMCKCCVGILKSRMDR